MTVPHDLYIEVGQETLGMITGGDRLDDGGLARRIPASEQHGTLHLALAIGSV